MHAIFTVILTLTAVLSAIDLSKEYSNAANSGEGIEFALLPIALVFWVVVAVSEICLWISTAHLTSDVCNKRWFWTVYDSINTLLSLTSLCVMTLYRFGNISNKTSEIAFYTIGGTILLQIIGSILRAVNNPNNK